MEVSSYPCAWKMEDCLGYCNTGYSAFHGDGFNHGYNHGTASCQELLDLWNLAFVQPYVDLGYAAGDHGYLRPGDHGYLRSCMQEQICVRSMLDHSPQFIKESNPVYLLPEQVYPDVNFSAYVKEQSNENSPTYDRYMHDQLDMDLYRSYTVNPSPCSNVNIAAYSSCMLQQQQQQQHVHVHSTGDSSPCSKRNFGGDFFPRDGKSLEVPHGAFYLVLQYLGLPEMLCMEQVCKSLHGWIRSDTSLWRDLRVEQPLSNRLTDDALTSLSARAQGYLSSLVLIDCPLISNDAIHEVLVTNLMLSKLHLLWRSQVSADALVRMVQQHVEIGGRKLQQLWIRGLHLRMSREQLEELKEALVPGEVKPKPQFYDVSCESSACKDERCMDVEACPRCGNPRVIYDCSRPQCREKRGAEECRGCISCIARCRTCGTCLAEVKFRECFNMELMCYGCSEMMMIGGGSGAGTGIFLGGDEEMDDSFE